MSKFTMQINQVINGKELFEIHQEYFGVRFQPIAYTNYNDKVEQINIIDNMTHRCIKECYQIRSANTFMNKLFNKLNNN